MAAFMENSNERIKWDTQEYSLADLIEAFPRDFPLVVKVTEGYLGDSQWETLSTGEVLRLHGWGRHRRVLAKDSKGRYFSIPEGYPVPFRPVLHHKVREAVPLGKIIHDHELPVEIRMDPSGNTNFHLRDDPSRMMRFGDLVIEQAYQERYFKANIIDNGRPRPEIMVLPTYVSARVSVAVGASTPGEWKIMTSHWNDIAKQLFYHRVGPNMDIILFSERQIDACRSTEAVYEMLRPEHHLSNTAMEDATSATHSYADLAKARQSCHLVTETTLNIYEPVAPPKPEAMYPHARWVPPVDDLAIPQQEGSRVTGSSATPAKPPPKTKPKPPLRPKKESDDYHKVPKGKISVDTGPVPMYPLPRRDNSIRSAEDIPPDISGLTINQVTDCLKLLHMAQHIPAFRDEQVNGSLLMSLDETLLNEAFGLSKLEAKKLRMFATQGYRPT